MSLQEVYLSLLREGDGDTQIKISDYTCVWTLIYYFILFSDF
jgi:hypothetical protein